MRNNLTPNGFAGSGGLESFFLPLADEVSAANDPRIIDLTAKADKSRRFITRDPKKVYALVLHQMACCFKVGDPLTRFLKMAPHFAILPDGRILQLHPILSLTGASNGFNAGSVAVEFAGNFPDTRGKWWDDKKELKSLRKKFAKLPEAQIQARIRGYIKANQNQVTPQQIEAGRYLVKYLIRVMGLKVIVAHRQSSEIRPNDPGPDIWYHVGQWAVDTLGLKDGGPGFKIDKGNSIPDLWRTWGKVKPQPELEFGAYESEAWESEVNRSTSEYIRWVQAGLNRILGLQLAVDGIAGVQTKSAIRSFQTKRGLVVDGIVGPKTEAALVTAGAGPAPGGLGAPVSGSCPAPTPVDCPVPGTPPTEVLDNFGHNVATLNPPLHTPRIKKVAAQIIASQSSPHPMRTILIAGHTDPTGSDNFNFDLARRRAETVAQELCVAVGPAVASRLKFNLTSCGERQLKATPELSRRVELFLPKIVSPPTQPRRSGKCNFRPSVHGFKFLNSFTIPPAIPALLKTLRINARPGPYGLCGGMSFLAADFYSFGKPIPSTSMVPPMGTPLYNKLVARQLDSLKLNVSIGGALATLGTLGIGIPAALASGFAAPAFKFWVWMGLPDSGRGSTAQKTAAELAIINPILRRGSFALLGLVKVNRSGSLFDNHQVLAYCLTQRAPNNFVYSIYDPNHPLRDDISIEVQIVRGEAQVFQVVPARGGGAPKRTAVRGVFNMEYSPVRP